MAYLGASTDFSVDRLTYLYLSFRTHTGVSDVAGATGTKHISPVNRGLSYSAYALGTAATLAVFYLIGVYTRRAFAEVLREEPGSSHEPVLSSSSRRGSGETEVVITTRGRGDGEVEEEKEEGADRGSGGGIEAKDEKTTTTTPPHQYIRAASGNHPPAGDSTTSGLMRENSNSNSRRPVAVGH